VDLFYMRRRFSGCSAAALFTLAPGFSQVILDLTFITTVLTVFSADAQLAGSTHPIAWTPFYGAENSSMNPVLNCCCWHPASIGKSMVAH
jgi:hypothetical protein